MVAPRIPNQLTDNPVVLVKFIAAMGEDDIRTNPALQDFEVVFDRRRLRGEIRAFEAFDHDVALTQCRGGARTMVTEETK